MHLIYNSDSYQIYNLVTRFVCILLDTPMRFNLTFCQSVSTSDICMQLSSSLFNLILSTEAKCYYTYSLSRGSI